MSLVILVLMVCIVFGVQALLLVLRRRQAPTVAREPASKRHEPLGRPIVPPATFIAPAHTWLRFCADGTLRIGVDELLAGALGTIDAVELPPSGTRVERGDPLVALRTGDRVLEVPAPAGGEVVARNDLVTARPTDVATDPYGLGWLVRLQPQDHKQALEPLFIGRGANGFLRREYARLVELLTHASSPAHAHMADGALLERGALARVDPEVFRAFSEQFLRSA